MGFGLLLIGYFLSFVTAFAQVYFFADIFGGALMVYALYKLSAYSEKFKNTLPSAMMFTFLASIAGILSLFNLTGTFITIINFVQSVVILIFHIFMFTALEDMARGADDEKLANKTKRDMIITAIYNIFCIISIFSGAFMNDNARNYLSVIMFFYGILAITLNLLLLHSAYCRLYIEGTAERYAELPKFKESKIGFINKIKHKYYESQKKALEDDKKMMQEAKDYIEANRHKIPAKKKKKH